MILRADARQIPLRDEVVQVVVTSPPYWGLRDYGTGRWEGGVPFCDHGDPKERNGNRTRADTNGDAIESEAGGYKKGREDYGTNDYPSIGYEKLVKRAGFGTRNECPCGAKWVDAAIGLENSLDSYLHQIVAVFREVRRVLKADGLVFLNLGDKYDKQTLLGLPWRVALALQSDGWFLRSDIIWHKPNPMPEALSTKRCTTSHEYLFMLSKSGMDYFWDGKAIEEKVVEDRHSCGRGYKRTRGQSYIDQEGKEHSLDDPWDAMKMQPGGSGVRGNQSWGQYTIGAGYGPELRNKRDVWTITVEHSPEVHYATFPQALVLPCVLAGSRVGDLVYDPFGGTSTVGYVAERLGRKWVTTELAWDYCLAAKRRTAQLGLFR